MKVVKGITKLKFFCKRSDPYKKSFNLDRSFSSRETRLRRSYAFFSESSATRSASSVSTHPAVPKLPADEVNMDC